jgi:Tfp pilus assembly protein PilX
MHPVPRNQRGQSLVIVLSLITLMFLLGSALAVHASVALRATRSSEGQGDDFYAADAATELGIWWQRNGKPGNPPAQTINGITTSTTISTAGGGGGSCPAAPSITWMSGFETGVIWQATGANANDLAGGFTGVASGSSGIVDAVSSPARTGSYAMRVAPNSWASDYAYLSAPYGITLGPTVVAHFAIRMGALPTTDAPVFTIMNNSSNGWQHGNLFLYYRPSTGKWAIGMSLGLTPNVYQESSVTAVVGTWYSFDIRYQITGTDTRKAEWYLDGVAQQTASVVDSAGSGSGPMVVFGQWGTSTFGGAYTAYYDDVILSTTSANFPVGDINISPIKPDGMGTNVNPGSFEHYNTNPISATSWQTLTETPMDTNVGSIRQIVVGATSYIETTLQDTTQTCIRGADVVMATHPAGTSANNHKTSIFDGATESILYSGDASIANTALAFAIRPITPGGAWTQARVNGLKLRFGYGSDINPNLSWDAALVEVASTTVNASPATVTIVGTGGSSTVSADYPDAGAGVPTLSTWTVTK